MSRDVSNYIKLTVPEKFLDKNPHGSSFGIAMEQLTKLAGGVTITEGNGIWYDEGKPVTEGVAIYQFNFSNAMRESCRYASMDVVTTMFIGGEKAVLRERYYNDGSGYRSEILYAPKFD